MASDTVRSALSQINGLFAEGTATGLSDSQLLDRFLAKGNAAAFEALVVRHGPLVMSVCRGILRDPNDAEDAFQATFSVLLKKSGSIRRRNALGGWLHRVAHRVAVHANVTAARRRLHERQAGQMADVISQTGPVLSGELLTALHEEIARLPEKHRLAMVLCDLQGIPQAEAARQLCWSERALRYRLSEGRDRLKARLTRRGLALDSSTMASLFLREATARIPAAWRENSVRAVLAATNHTATAGAVSAVAEQLARGVLNTMFLSNLKMISVPVILAAVVGSVAVVTQQNSSPRNVPGADDPVRRLAASEHPLIETRVINKRVGDFPEKTDLSTPEAAQAAWYRASGRMDDRALAALSWMKLGWSEVQQIQRIRKNNPQETEVFNQAQLNAEILEVTSYRGNSAFVISRLGFPEGTTPNPYSLRSFGRINGVWKNLGEDRLPSLETARAESHDRMFRLWWYYEQVRDKITQGLEVSARGESESRRVRIAPGEPLGITVEKADLMGRVEWVMLHGGRDVTGRKPIEWGEIQRDAQGNRTIRFNYDETIRDKGVFIMNQVFTFDAKGNIVDIEDIDGFPIRRVDQPVNVNTQEGMKSLVEDFFNKNFRHITARESLEWGEVAKAANGNSSIRYKCRGRIWDKEPTVMNFIFTFDPRGGFVGVNDAE